MSRLALAAVLALATALPAAAQTTGEPEGLEVVEQPQLGPAVFLSIDGERAYRVDDWIGAPVRLRASTEEIGDIESLILGEDGQTIAAIVGVGGFLGIGEKEVAVDISSLRALREEGDLFLEIDATREQIEAAEPVVIPD